MKELRDSLTREMERNLERERDRTHELCGAESQKYEPLVSGADCDCVRWRKCTDM